jgi:hypothetical protein
MTVELPLFGRKSKGRDRPGPPPAEMRGRAAEITDPAGLDWEVVWEALKTEPPADDPATIAQELGLGEEREVSQAAEMPATELSGTRHGRRAALRMGVVPSGWRDRGATEVQVEAAVAPFRVEADGGRLVAEPGASTELEEALGELAPAPDVWRDLTVEGGPDGILARRAITMKGNPQGYVYDLWLVERLADRLGA